MYRNRPRVAVVVVPTTNRHNYMPHLAAAASLIISWFFAGGGGHLYVYYYWTVKLHWELSCGHRETGRGRTLQTGCRNWDLSLDGQTADGQTGRELLMKTTAHRFALEMNCRRQRPVKKSRAIVGIIRPNLQIEINVCMRRRWRNYWSADNNSFNSQWLVSISHSGLAQLILMKLI